MEHSVLPGKTWPPFVVPINKLTISAGFSTFVFEVWAGAGGKIVKMDDADVTWVLVAEASVTEEVVAEETVVAAETR